MLVALQLVAVAAVPLKVTVLAPGASPKSVPVTVTLVPGGPEGGHALRMPEGAGTLVAAQTRLFAD